MPTIRDNDFQFTMSGLTDVRFQETSHSITDNQPYEGVSKSGANQLRVRAGRKGSEGVAGWFNRETHGCAVAKTYSDHNPGKLNFAVRGKLALTVGATTYQSEPDVFLAQGHAGSSNNWWLGSSGMTGIDWTGGGPAVLEAAKKAVESATAGAAAAAGEDPAAFAKAVEGYWRNVVQIFMPNNAGAGILPFRGPDGTYLFAFEMGNSDTTVRNLGRVPN